MIERARGDGRGGGRKGGGRAEGGEGGRERKEFGRGGVDSYYQSIYLSIYRYYLSVYPSYNSTEIQ